jgi:heme oxygenase
MVDILQIVRVPKPPWTRLLECELASLKSYRPNRTTCEKKSQIVSARQSEIKTSIHAKQHTVLAHTWVMYTALFNGGRMIRNELLAASSAFWQCLNTPSNFEQRAHLILSKRLRFWDFGNGKDGDDVKEDFKKRFEIAASWLTASERVGIVDEAVRTFGMLHEMVDWLEANANANANAELDVIKTRRTRMSPLDCMSTTPRRSNLRAFLARRTRVTRIPISTPRVVLGLLIEGDSAVRLLVTPGARSAW